MTNATLKLSSAALRRAADWLEQNRDKHIIGYLALDHNHREVEPFDPKAECFCAYGRYMVELGEPARIAYDTDELPEVLKLGVYVYMKKTFGVDFDEVYRRNDRKDFNPGDTAGGNPAVIPYLRHLADQIEHDAR